MPRMRYCSTQPLGSSGASPALLLFLLVPAFLGCSDEGESDSGADLTVEWYDPETKMVKRSEGRQKYGREEGQWSFFHENGRLERQGSYTSGMKSGVWTGWYPNGAVMRRGSFVGDQPDGLWEEFHPTGVVSARTSWANGKIIGKQRRFYPDGGVRTETPFAKGVPHGLEMVYHQGGEVYWAKNFVNGMAEGESVARHPGGGLHFICTFRQGKKVGDWHYWHSGGEYKGLQSYDETGKMLGTWLDYGPQGQAVMSRAHGGDGSILAQQWTPAGQRQSYGKVNPEGRPVGTFFVWQPDGRLDEALSGMHDGERRTGPLAPEDVARAVQLAAVPDAPALRPADAPRREDFDPGQ
ncbi:MAG TPA: toxin-antitoxin system YwqK family antitoxin [Planctomycetes bacterium]|nr:toxin-antitoxin system YwqK family antitoxin [Planctomycetota bacterium]HIL38601.1 toxin-antitoxin system YwqK family antitoxin [Planctomycetota bacterium]